MLIHLTLIVCLSAEPTVCQEVLVGYEEDILPSKCLTQGVGARAESKRWEKDHPEWFVRNSSCIPGWLLKRG